MKDPTATDIFKIGQVLNNTYEILGVLGRGGTGEVYLARNVISERQVAIKALNAQFSGNSDYIELMKREEQMRNILHDAVVRYAECSLSDEGRVFLVMDYIEGPSLNEVMYGLKLDEQDLLVVAQRVLEGLIATHAKGIVHRDLSPDNIILKSGEPGRATIIDFGIAKDTSAGAQTIVGNNFAGKYEYAAPEQLDGQSDFRADLYALGASLLAAARREVPDVGTTPAGMLRTKRAPLDTSGLTRILRDLIDMLTAIDPDDRPPNAREALETLNGWLTPRSTVVAPPPKAPPKRKGWRKGALAAAALVAGVGIWGSGALDGIFDPRLPIIDPYTLVARAGDGDPTLSGHAPDQATADVLRAAFEASVGVMPPAESISLAEGMPSEEWPNHVGTLFDLAQQLVRWDLAVSDTDVTLSGLAPDRAQRDALSTQLAALAERNGLTLTTDLTAGPERLDAADVTSAIAPLARCGPLSQLDGNGAVYALSDVITITGDLPDRDTRSAVETALGPVIGDRRLRMETTVLNDELCAIRSVLPAATTGAVSIRLGRGDSGQAALTGVYRTGENPVADVHLPGNLTDASLWVMVVDTSGTVFHILPNINSPEQNVELLGEVSGGLRRVRVLWPLSAKRDDPTLPAMVVDDQNYGKSEVVAIVSRTPLFDMRRPGQESVASVAEALTERLEGREEDILGVASRILDARP